MSIEKRHYVPGAPRLSLWEEQHLTPENGFYEYYEHTAVRNVSKKASKGSTAAQWLSATENNILVTRVKRDLSLWRAIFELQNSKMIANIFISWPLLTDKYQISGTLYFSGCRFHFCRVVMHSWLSWILRVAILIILWQPSAQSIPRASGCKQHTIQWWCMSIKHVPFLEARWYLD